MKNAIESFNRILSQIGESVNLRRLFEIIQSKEKKDKRRKK